MLPRMRPAGAWRVGILTREGRGGSGPRITPFHTGARTTGRTVGGLGFLCSGVVSVLQRPSVRGGVLYGRPFHRLVQA